MRKIRTVR